MTRTDILNLIAARIAARYYLEIGVRNPADNFARVNVPYKTGVDPAPTIDERVLRRTSDDFFDHFDGGFDLVFIDGLHEEDQAFRDASNALARLHFGGVIVMHDCLPATQAASASSKPPGGGPWNGTVWRAWLRVRALPGILTCCVDADHGCGIAWRGDALPQSLVRPIVATPENLSWYQWSMQRNAMAGVVSARDFGKAMGKA